MTEWLLNINWKERDNNNNKVKTKFQRTRFLRRKLWWLYKFEIAQNHKVALLKHLILGP